MKHCSTRVKSKITFPLVAFALLLLVKTATAQSPITFTLLKQPCNNDGILVAHTTGIPTPITFTWRHGNQTITNTVNSTTDTLYNYNGSYVYVYTSGLSQSYGTYAGSPPFTFADTITPAVCPALPTVRVSVTGGIAPYTYQWFDMNGVQVNAGNPVNLPGGWYNVLITDSAGCTFGTYAYGPFTSGANYGAIRVENLTNLKDTIKTTPANCTNGTATVTSITGGVAPYTYEWSNGANTAALTGLSGGTYKLTITDAQGCYLERFVTIQQSVTITVNTNVTHATCQQNNGSIIAFGAGGASPYSYMWSNAQNTQIATGLAGGSYSVTATDANNCTGVKFASVTATTPVTVTYTTTPSSCTAPTGTATLSITGGKAPYTVNWGTFPAQSGTTASALMPGTYNFMVTDSNGCARNGTVTIPPVSVVSGIVLKGDATCTQNNGSASVSIATGTPPYTYVWSNGSTASTISGLAAGGYTVTITDKLSCTLVKAAIVKAATPIRLALIPSQASCIFTADGSIAANVSGGTAPYTYSWSNGQTTATATGLLTGYYSLFVRDAAGCVQSERIYLGYNSANNSCYCTLTGRVYVDTNTNCLFDSGEKGVQNVMVHASGLGYAFTDASGMYSFKVPTGNYTISETVQAYYPLAPCQNNAIPVSVTAGGNCISTQNFANVVNPLHDVKISTISFNTPPVVGYDYFQRVVVENNGTVTEPNVQLRYRHDGQLRLVNVAPPLLVQPDSANDPAYYVITDSFPTLAPGAKQVFNLEYHVPANIPLNTEVVFHDTTTYDEPVVMNWLTDYSPWDNVNEHTTVTVGSFDPNDKEVSPRGDGADGFIGTYDSLLTYTVRFQNTGNYPARKVVVIDTLDSDLEFTSLKPGYSSHNYVADMSEDGIVKFTFNNINLPDSVSQPEASIGVVLYTVKQKPGLLGGTRITSPASIYFDFNVPIQTNDVLNTIEIITGVKRAIEAFAFNLFPNPASNYVSLDIESEVNAKATLRFYNILGEAVQSQTFQMDKGENRVQADISSLTPGIYLAVVTDGYYTYTRKLSVLK